MLKKLMDRMFGPRVVDKKTFEKIVRRYDGDPEGKITIELDGEALLKETLVRQFVLNFGIFLVLMAVLEGISGSLQIDRFIGSAIGGAWILLTILIGTKMAYGAVRSDLFHTARLALKAKEEDDAQA